MTWGSEWSDEAVAESFRAEIRSRFEMHNAAYRAREAAELETVLREHPEQCGQPGFAVRDSLAWEVYQGSEVRVDRNSVTIVLPHGIAIGIDLVHLFDHTAMAWSRAMIGATIVDGEPRTTIEILLVATWNDDLDAARHKEGGQRQAPDPRSARRGRGPDVPGSALAWRRHTSGMGVDSRSPQGGAEVPAVSEPIALGIRVDVPCPFCGGLAELHKQLRNGHSPDNDAAYAYFYVCASCAACGGWGKTESLALRMWNLRTSTATVGPS